MLMIKYNVSANISSSKSNINNFDNNNNNNHNNNNSKNNSNNCDINNIDFTKIGHHFFLHPKSAPVR